MFRWNIAIKTIHRKSALNNYQKDGSSLALEVNLSDEISSLMEEAKTMLKVGCYHEHIVNLQGITAQVDGADISQVLHFSNRHQVPEYSIMPHKLPANTTFTFS